MRNLSLSVIFIFSTLLFISEGSRADEKGLLKIVAPYLPENVERDGKSGRDLSIFKKIVECTGHSIQVDVQPYLRHVKSYLADEKYDGIMTLPSGQSSIQNQTNAYIAYNNGVIVRVEDFPKGVKNVTSLRGKHVISFLGGEYLLKGLKNKTKSFASYTETATQYRHNEMLMKKRVDAVFSDGLIFMAHQKRLLKKVPRWNKIKVKFYHIFSVNDFFASFKNPKITQAFNGCLEKLNKSGKLNKIERSYADKYHNILGDEYSKPLIR